MEIKFNSTYKTLLDKYNLPTDLNFNVALPKTAQHILTDKIIINQFGLGLESNWTPTSCDNPANQSFHEDNENHLHIDYYVDHVTSKSAFELGTKILTELAKRFEKEKINNVQLTYSFQTPEMSEAEAKANNIENDEHFISDKLSFHTKRPGQVVVDSSLFNNKHYAFLTIDL